MQSTFLWQVAVPLFSIAPRVLKREASFTGVSGSALTEAPECCSSLLSVIHWALHLRVGEQAESSGRK